MSGDKMLRDAVTEAMSKLSEDHAGVGFLVVAVDPVGNLDMAEVMATHNLPEDLLAKALQHVSADGPQNNGVLH